MKKHILAAVLALAVSASGFALNPKANPKAVVSEGNARFTVLTPEIIRVEYSPSGQFEDRATFAVVNRELPVPKFKKRNTKDYLYINTGALELRYRKGADFRNADPADSVLTITMSLGGKPVVWYPGLKDTQNLKGTTRTLDGSNGDNKLEQMEDGILSRSGWAIIDDSPKAQRGDGSRSLAFEPVEGDIDWVAPRADADAADIYFMGYGHDYKRALKDFTRIAGDIPLPPRFVFGYWYSRYAPYSADQFREIVNTLNEKDLPTDVMILDMDWHYNGNKDYSDGRGGWTGWTWNRNLIPDPEGLLNDIHKGGMRTALNLHPASGFNADEDYYAPMAKSVGMDPAKGENVPWMLDNRNFYRAFFDNFIHENQKRGVDFWWLDWQQALLNPRVDGLGQTFWCNHVFFNEMKNFRPDRRPLIFHRWGGLGSHRYQIGFSGDASINFPTLAFQPYFTATSSNVGYAYWGHDLGGHHHPGDDPNDPERLLRWVQFGVFTPIFRTHATSSNVIDRRMWVYPNFDDLKAYVKLRYALMPYIYTMARQTYDTGVGMVRPLYYEFPEQEESYSRRNEYFFGDNILVSPIVTRSEFGTSHENIWLPEGKWWSMAHNELLEGNKTYDRDFSLRQFPWFVREGGIVPMNPASVNRAATLAATLELVMVAGPEGSFTLYEDQGDSNDYDTVYGTTEITQKHSGNTGTYTIGAIKGDFPGKLDRRAYTLRIYNTEAPVSATLNGKAIATPAYDSASRCTTVSLPAASTAAARTLKIEYK